MSANPNSFLTGGGEMGMRMRQHDWTATPLGPPDQWPRSLRTVVRVMLDSRFAMWMAWGEERIFLCNDAYLPTVGLKRDWVLGARADHVWAEIWCDIGPRIDHVMATGDSTWDDALPLFLDRNGYLEETFHTFSYSPVSDDAGRVAGMLCVVVEDTDRVIGERRLRLLGDMAALPSRDADTLLDAGRQLMLALASRDEDLPFAALYLCDDDGDATAHCVAVTRETLWKLLPDRVALDDAPSPWCIGRAIQQSQPQTLEQLEARCGAIAGRWAEAVQTALVLPLNTPGRARPQGALVAGASTRRRLDRRYREFMSLLGAQIASHLADTAGQLEQRRRAEALAELDRAKNTFFSNVSHEFRTPLTLMLGPIEALLDDPALPDSARESAELVQRNALRLRKLVNTLLEFSRLEAGRAQVRLVPTDLAMLTRELVAAFRSAVEQAGLRLIVDCKPLPEPVSVDADLWEHVVYNLLSNAFKFTFDGQIDVRLEARGPMVELSVRDTGVGIEPAALPHVFERFHRVAGVKSRSLEGTGIGLALVREVARLHGGSVRAESTPDAGSCFTVSIPRGQRHRPSARVDTRPAPPRAAPDAAQADEEPRSSGPAAGQAPVGPPPARSADPASSAAEAATPADRRARLLVADDNADMRDYLSRLLAPRWRVETAQDGLQALQRIRESPPDLVVTDVMMPGLDGFGLVDRLRADPATRAVPVLVLSAQAGEEARVAGLQRGADDYLVKPFSSRELIARIEVQLMRVELRDVQQALDRRLGDVFRHAPLAMAVLRGPSHVIEFANADFAALAAPELVVGRPLAEALPGLAGADVLDALERAKGSGRVEVRHSAPVRLPEGAAERAAGGGIAPEPLFDLVFQPLGDPGDPLSSIAMVCIDVTESIRGRRKAEAASRAKDEFIAMLGHELRNPLAPIVTALQLMKMQWAGSAVYERGIIERQVQHMIRLVDDLLDVARIARGAVELKKSVVELSAVVARAIETAGPLLEQRRQPLRLEVPEQGLELQVDPMRMSQVVANLLTNAAKFSEPGAPIGLRAQRDGDTVRLEVVDSGAGMSADELGSVFDIFVQGAQGLNRPRGGLGLGLTIARGLATMHGGSLSATSEGLGRGSRFVLQLPALAEAGRPAAARPPAEPAGDGGGRRVLLVDDNADAAQTLAQLLEMWNYRTVIAHDGPSALAAAADTRFDVAVLDIGLPVMDGYELARQLRASPGGPSLRLIALTGYGQESAHQRSRNAGFDLHLVKPVDLDRLMAALQAPDG